MLRDKLICQGSSANATQMGVVTQHSLNCIAQHLGRRGKVLRLFKELSGPNVANQVNVSRTPRIGIDGLLEL